MSRSLLRRTVWSSIVCLGIFDGFAYPATSQAGTWIAPTDVTDAFASAGNKPFTVLLNPLTGELLPTPLDVLFRGGGPTAVARDNVDAAFLQDGRDTINTEIVSFRLSGKVLDFTAEIIAGLGQGFAGFSPLTTPTRGQIQDLALSPQDGVIDFPADSVFDVFFDVWVDFNDDGNVDVGEVFSNDVSGIDNFALRMQNLLLPAVPPPPGQSYFGVAAIDENDPEIGTFQATELLLPLDLYRIDANRQPLALDGLKAFATGGANARHDVVPEPSGAAIWSLLAMMGTMLVVRRRRTSVWREAAKVA